MESWNKLVGKEVVVIYNDNGRHPIKKIGFLLEHDLHNFALQSEKKDPEILNKAQIIRVVPK